MHLQDINKIINLQEINITNISDVIDNTVEFIAEPINYIQPCPCCGSMKVIRRGITGYRRVRHLPIFNNKTILLLPKVRLFCKECNISFTLSYSFVNGKSRYTNQYKLYISDEVTGSTVTHASRVTNTPYSTTERIFKEYLDNIIPEISKTILSISKATSNLVIGIDDFAIRKGHSYNTGIHDLRNEALLHVAKGRKLKDLREDKCRYPEVYNIKPIAVVMDLAPYYHTFTKETFPDALRIADRFHVNKYALDGLQNVRKRISSELSPRNRVILKQNKNLISKRNDQLNNDELKLLKQLLSLSSELANTYAWKEQLIDWYDCCININQASIVFERWLQYGHSLNIPEIEVALKTFENWREEIINYHACRFTNAAVEGRNNKIKALQRRHYFTRNRKYYDARILLECNYSVLTV